MIPLIDYAINKDYIANNLCSNKNKPKMKCNGKCHLMKEMAKNSENDKDSSQKTTIKLVEIIPNKIEEKIFNSVFIYLDKKLPLDSYLNLYSFNTSTFLMKPPIKLS